MGENKEHTGDIPDRRMGGQPRLGMGEKDRSELEAILESITLEKIKESTDIQELRTWLGRISSFSNKGVVDHKNSSLFASLSQEISQKIIALS